MSIDDAHRELAYLRDPAYGECGRCALEAQHPPEPCAYVCGNCGGTIVGCGRCVVGLVYDGGWGDGDD